MDAEIGLQLVILIVLIYLSSFFSSAETAMMSVSRLRLRPPAAAESVRRREQQGKARVGSHREQAAQDADGDSDRK